MLGFVTKAKHEAALAVVEGQRDANKRFYDAAAHRADYWQKEAERLAAEIDHLRPLAQKHLNSLAALKQNKGKGK